ncbi:MAG: hypothetical protein KDB23_31900, partial [Planctomycetales bacterium]|nr:hypothetical protein [Planctomycetales bacterium]
RVALRDVNGSPSAASLKPTAVMVGWTGVRALPGITVATETGTASHVCLTNFGFPASIVFSLQGEPDAIPPPSPVWDLRVRPLHGKLRMRTTTHPDAYFYQWLQSDRDLSPRVRLAAAYYLVGEWHRSLAILESQKPDTMTIAAELLQVLCQCKLGQSAAAAAAYSTLAKQLGDETPAVGLELLTRMAAHAVLAASTDTPQLSPAATSVDRSVESIERRLAGTTMEAWDPWLYLQHLEAKLDLGLTLSSRELQFARVILELSKDQDDFKQAMTTLELMQRAFAHDGNASSQALDQVRFELWQVCDRLGDVAYADGVLPERLDHPLLQIERTARHHGLEIRYADALHGPVVTLFTGQDGTLPDWQLNRIHQLERDYSKKGLRIAVVMPSEEGLSELRQRLSMPDSWITMINAVPVLQTEAWTALFTVDGKFDASVATWWQLESAVHEWFRTPQAATN